MHRQFFETISQNPVYVKTFCTDLNDPIHFGIRNCYLQIIPQCRHSIITPIQIQKIIKLIEYLYK